jgi:RNA polymerase sigma factor (sigma-70 family)
VKARPAVAAGEEGGRMADDAELLVAARTSVAAFETFYRRYVRRVTAFAATRCASAEDAADVVALTFVRLLDALDRYDPERAEPGPFVMGIAANVARDLHRRHSRHQALVARLSGRDLLDSDDTGRVEAAIDAARAAVDVRAALSRVPSAQQEMVRLVADGRTPGEAADELGISPGAGWTRLSRARGRLRRHLPAADEEYGR